MNPGFLGLRTWLVGVLLGVPVIAAEPPEPRSRDFTRWNRYQVGMVLSGDHVTVQWRGQAVLMHLMGVEAIRPEARDWLKESLAGRSVYIEYDPSGPFDRLGKPCAYLYRAG